MGSRQSRKIIEKADNFDKSDTPGLDNLSSAVRSEILYLKALWAGDAERAYAHAKDVLGFLEAAELRGYRAWWHYLAGSAAAIAASQGGLQQSIAGAQFEAARKAAPSISWLSKLAGRTTGRDVATPTDVRAVLQTEKIEAKLYSFGILKNNNLRKKLEEVSHKLTGTDQFEAGLVELGELLGFNSANTDDQSGPDPWWFIGDTGVVFEANVGAQAEGVFKSEKCRQAAMHPQWIRQNVGGAADVDFLPVIITPKEEAAAGSEPFLANVKLWHTQSFSDWFDEVFQFLTEINSTLPPETDLAWRSDVAAKLANSKFTIDWLRSGLSDATVAFKFRSG